MVVRSPRPGADGDGTATREAKQRQHPAQKNKADTQRQSKANTQFQSKVNTMQDDAVSPFSTEFAVWIERGPGRDCDLALTPGPGRLDSGRW